MLDSNSLHSEKVYPLISAVALFFQAQNMESMDDIRQQLDSVQKEKEQLEELFTKERQTLQEEISEVRASLQKERQLSDEHQLLQQQKDSLEKEKDHLQDQLAEERSRLAEVTQKLEEEKGRLLQRTQQLQEEKAQLEETLKALEAKTNDNVSTEGNGACQKEAGGRSVDVSCQLCGCY